MLFYLRVVHQNREDEKNPAEFFEFLSIRFEPFFAKIHPVDLRTGRGGPPLLRFIGPFDKIV
jgi:hypothetical protein